GPEHLTVGFRNDVEFLVPFGFAEHLAENGGVRAFGDAVHAAGAVFGNVFGNFRGDVGEIAQACGAGGHKRAGQGEIGREVFLAVAFLVAADDAFVEVVDIEHGQVDRLVGSVNERAVAVVVVGIAFVGLVERGSGGCGSGHY